MCSQYSISDCQRTDDYGGNEPCCKILFDLGNNGEKGDNDLFFILLRVIDRNIEITVIGFIRHFYLLFIRHVTLKSY